jgi:GH25 family lysozyme M1 (1,4-beta-N-acetylmuramidase)
MTRPADLHLADVSAYQPAINWDDYAAGGRAGVFVKATEGTSYVSELFAGQRAGAHAAGLVFVGLYHFARTNSPALAQLVQSLQPGEVAAFHPHWTVTGRGRYRYHRQPVPVTHGHLGLAAALPLAVSAPRGEAGHFLAAIGSLAPGEVAVLDAEVPGLSAAWCRAWLSAVEQATGRTPLLYCSWSFWGDVLGEMADYPLWIAAYHGLGHDDPRDSVPGCRFWQYSDNAQVPGVGSCDDSVFRGTVAELAALAGGAPPAPPAPADPLQLGGRTLLVSIGD